MTDAVHFDADSARFAIFSDSMKRSRWLLLISTLLSSLVLIHMYLQEFSYQEVQHIDTLRLRAIKNTEQKFLEQQAEIKEHHRVSAIPDSKRTIKEKLAIMSPETLEARAEEYAGRRYRMALTNNHLEDVVLPDRSLPFIAIPIPANDFLPVIGAMLFVFVVATWLSIRSIGAAVYSLVDSPPLDPAKLRELIRLQFTFTGLHDRAQSRTFAQISQFVAFGLPGLALLVATAIDFYSLVPTNQGNPGPAGPLFWRMFVIVVELIAVWAVVWRTIRLDQRIDRVVDLPMAKGPEGAGPALP